MQTITTIGADIAKSVLQIHGVDAGGAVVIRKRVSRAKVVEFFANLPPCLVGMEVCATAHQWARELKKLGHDTRLMPPTYVKAYVKRGKNDAADAAAICEGVTRPSMRFVPIKSVEQQSGLMLHRTGHSSDGPSWVDLAEIRVSTTESRFGDCLNRLLQQNRIRADISI